MIVIYWLTFIAAAYYAPLITMGFVLVLVAMAWHGLVQACR